MLLSVCDSLWSVTRDAEDDRRKVRRGLCTSLAATRIGDAAFGDPAGDPSADPGYRFPTAFRRSCATKVVACGTRFIRAAGPALTSPGPEHPDACDRRRGRQSKLYLVSVLVAVGHLTRCQSTRQQVRVVSAWVPAAMGNVGPNGLVAVPTDHFAGRRRRLLQHPIAVGAAARSVVGIPACAAAQMPDSGILVLWLRVRVFALRVRAIARTP